jgi:hypothetical protein
MLVIIQFKPISVIVGLLVIFLIYSSGNIKIWLGSNAKVTSKTKPISEMKPPAVEGKTLLFRTEAFALYRAASSSKGFFDAGLIFLKLIISKI